MPASAEPTRQDLENEEDSRLAPWAMRSAGAARRVPLAPDGRVFDYRTEFQRDRDRVLHSRAFRRLRLKSHGGAIPPDERYRDRLTHTLEVSQLSRTVARGLGLNEDLTEAIALAHELGMPPFGRAGEAALAALLQGRAGGFRADCQSLRVVDRLEKRYEHEGINLTDATREGILKHAGFAPATGGGPLAGAELRGLRLGSPPFFEAQVVGAVEEIASVVQDLDDGLRAGEVELPAVERLPIVRELMRRIRRTTGRERTTRRALFMGANAINRGLTHMLVAGLIHHSRKTLRSWAREHQIDSPARFLAARASVAAGAIGLSPAARWLYDGVRDFVGRHLSQGAWLSGVASRAGHVLSGLFRALTDDPRLADDYLLIRFKQESGGPFLRDVPPDRIGREIARRYRDNPRYHRLVADHLAGMTDMYALAEHERLWGFFGPAAASAPPGAGARRGQAREGRAREGQAREGQAR